MEKLLCKKLANSGKTEKCHIILEMLKQCKIIWMLISMENVHGEERNEPVEEKKRWNAMK